MSEPRPGPGGLRLLAPAKINWTLEVLGRRDDGYHELRTVLQTIDLADTVVVAPAPDLTLAVTGEGAASLGAPESNLAYRAAALLRERFRVRAGARIAIEKRVPVAAGLGGGSSDAAATLRGLARLWGLDLDAATLAALAAELGSDAPFFVYGGTALAEGRGERVTPLPDAPSRDIALSFPGRTNGDAEGKTARLFAMLRPSDFADGAASAALAAALRAEETRDIPDLDARYVNTFERVADAAFPGLAARREALAVATGRAPRLAGAGPTLFVVVEGPSAEGLPANAVRARTLSREAALRVETVDG